MSTRVPPPVFHEVVSDIKMRRGVPVLVLHGALDAPASEGFEKALVQVLESSRYRVVLDLSRVTLVTSIGWGVILGQLKDVRAHHGSIALAAMSLAVGHVYDLLGMKALVAAYEEVDPAVEAVILKSAA